MKEKEEEKRTTHTKIKWIKILKTVVCKRKKIIVYVSMATRTGPGHVYKVFRNIGIFQ